MKLTIKKILIAFKISFCFFVFVLFIFFEHTIVVVVASRIELFSKIVKVVEILTIVFVFQMRIFHFANFFFRDKVFCNEYNKKSMRWLCDCWISTRLRFESNRKYYLSLRKQRFRVCFYKLNIQRRKKKQFRLIHWNWWWNSLSCWRDVWQYNWNREQQ